MKQTFNMNPEDQAKGMEAWMQWSQKCGDKPVDLGSPFINGQQLNPNGTSKNSDKNVAGYLILQAENMEDAKSLPLLRQAIYFNRRLIICVMNVFFCIHPQ